MDIIAHRYKRYTELISLRDAAELLYLWRKFEVHRTHFDNSNRTLHDPNLLQQNLQY